MKNFYLPKDARLLTGNKATTRCTENTERATTQLCTVPKHSTALRLFISLVLLIMIHGIAWGADTGWLSPTITKAENSVSNQDNVFTSNDQRATWNGGDDWADYGDFSISIPTGSTINGIEVRVEGYCETGSTTRQLEAVTLSWNNGSNFSSGKAITSFNGTESYKTIGGSSDTWGHTWTVTEFSNTNFRIKLDAAVATTGNDLYIDHVQVRIYYTVVTPPTISGFSPTSGCQSASGIVITGTNFTGATAVTFNGTTATYTVNSATQITATVPATATTGKIAVTTAGGTATSTGDFTVNTVPAQPSTITGDATPCQGSSQTYSVTNVAGVTYNWSLPAGWTGGSSSNSITVTVGSGTGNITVTPSNACGNGTARTLAVTLAPNYVAQFTGMSFGTTDWCAGETRDVTVTVTNTGCATWTSEGAGMNIGLKWDEDADYGGLPNSIPRVSVEAGLPAGPVEPGETVTYTFNNVPGSLIGGTNHLSFDVVREGVCWFANNSGGCGPGNSVYVSPAITINTAPAQPSAITGNAAPCEGATETYSVTNVAGLTYNWVLPSGWTGSGTTNSITVTVGKTAGTISVTPRNICMIEGPAQTLAVTLSSPQASDVTICSGETSQALTSSSVCPSGGSTNTGAVFAGTGTSSGSGFVWNNPTRVVANDNSNTTATGDGSSGDDPSQALNAIGFDFSIIDPGSTIDGIRATFGKYRSGSGWSSFGEVQDNSVKLIKAGNAVGTNKAATSTNWPTSETASEYGTTNDLWGTTWTVDEIKASDFGVQLIVDFTSVPILMGH